MPEGFEALGGQALRDIIAYLVGDVSRFRALDLTMAFTADTRHGLYQSREAAEDTLHFKKFGIVSVQGVPFDVVNPANSPSGGNVIVLNGGGGGSFSHSLPRKVEVKAGLAARRFYFLGGVAGWGAGDAHQGEVIMTVTIVYADGGKNIVALRDGVHFSDYVARIDVPGSRFAEGVVRDKQIRWFAIDTPRKAVVEKLVLESPGEGPAATTVAITADLEEKPLSAAAALGGDSAPAAPHEPPAPLKWEPGTRILVVGGGSSHDFKRWFDTADVATLRAMGGVSVNYTENPEVAARELPKVDVLVSSTNRKGFDTPEFREALMALVDSGKGLVLLHPGVWYNWPWPEYNKMLAGGGARGHDRLGEFEVKILKEHPVTKGVASSFKVTDELYLVTPDPAGAAIVVLASTSAALTTKKEHPSVWVVSHPKARIVCIALGHDGRVHDLPEYKTLLTNAVNWVGGK